MNFEQNWVPSPIADMASPGARAGATGAGDTSGQGTTSKRYRKPGKSAIQIFAQDRHKRAARMLGFALTANDPETWTQASAVFGLRLNVGELMMLAYSALRCLEPDERHEVFSAAHLAPLPAGSPPVPFVSPVNEALWWADLATPEEHEAYCLVCFRAMPKARQKAFLSYVQIEGMA